MGILRKIAKKVPIDKKQIINKIDKLVEDTKRNRSDLYDNRSQSPMNTASMVSQYWRDNSYKTN